MPKRLGRVPRSGPGAPRAWILRGLTVVAAVAFAVVVYAYLTLPDVRDLATTNPTTTAFMKLRESEAASQGRKLRHLHQWVRYNRISKNLQRAVIVAEDSRFFEHEGVDLEELRKSIEINIERGAAIRGASTITQQLAKNLYLSPSKSPIRKVRELIITRRMEAALSKARILEIYLNVIEWGDGIWGAEAAARSYFGTSAASVGPDQAALLAGAIINPRVYSPAHPNVRLVRRQRIIRSRMGGYTPPVAVPVTVPTPVPPAEEQPPIELQTKPEPDSQEEPDTAEPAESAPSPEEITPTSSDPAPAPPAQNDKRF